MNQFHKFNNLIQVQLDLMCATGKLFTTNVDTEVLWNLYLDSYPEGTNEIFRVRRENDCSCCHNFVRRYGNLIAIDNNNEIMSIWDIQPEFPYNHAISKLSAFVKSGMIKSYFLSEEKQLGVEVSHQKIESGDILTWNHFYYKPLSKFVNQTNSASVIGLYNDILGVFKRSLEELTSDSILTVLDLISQNSLYKGNEYKGLLEKFKLLQDNYNSLTDSKKINWLWKNLDINNPVSKIRNTAIGTLLIDISEGMELDKAVTRFEKVVAPTNYKRPKAVFSSKQIEESQAKCVELGIDLGRRYAIKDDITVNNVIYIDRSINISDDPFAILQANTIPKSLDKIEEISIEDFIKNVIPNSTEIELMVESKHRNNFMTLIAPINREATKLFKWNNNFSWSYTGNVTDSIKEKVKEAGGSVDGALRVSLSWNNYDDLDLAIKTPSGGHIYYGTKRDYLTRGTLDVDMNAGGRNSRTPVENIIFPALEYLEKGRYDIYVNNYNKRESQNAGFEVEIEFNGEIHNIFIDNNDVKHKIVGSVTYNKSTGFKFESSIKSTSITKTINNVESNQFQKVSMMMFSPNYWDEQQIGNKHYFFILENCISEETPRGFFNEYLRDDLIVHKRVFEALGSKMIVQPCENMSEQLSGLGFSSTMRNEFVVRVHGTFTRLLKIKI